MSTQPKRLYIHEVATRDGFQNEAAFVDTDDKIALVDALSACGYAKIEVTSFTSPKAIPALRDAEAVMHGIARAPGVVYTVLVPNVRGAERALSCGVDEVNLVMSMSESHNRANLRMTREQSFAQLRDVIRQILQVASQAGMQVGDVKEPEPEPLPPLHQEAYDAIEREDYDAAIAAYDKAIKENPRDAEAKAGRAQVRLMARTRDANPAAVRAAAAASAGDIAAQLAVADLDVLGGAVEDAFARLLDVVKATAGEERETVRERLVELFDVVGGEDERVVAARRALAAALY